MDKEYRLNEALFELPAGCEDQSVNIFRLPDERGGLAIVVVRDATEIGDTVESYAARQLKNLSGSLAQFKLLNKMHCQVDHRSAMSFAFSWVNAEGPVCQRQVMFLHLERAVVLTATEPGQFHPENEIIWRKLVASISIRR